MLPAGIVRITVTELYGDFVILTDKNECAKPEDNFCDKDVGICTNRRYGYDCSCPDDYTCKAGPNGPREPRNPATMFGRSERREKACFRRYV